MFQKGIVFVAEHGRSLASKICSLAKKSLQASETLQALGGEKSYVKLIIPLMGQSRRLLCIEIQKFVTG